MPAPHTEATTDYWQTLIGADEAAGLQGPPWRFGVPVPLPDRRFLVLPIRALAAEPRHGVASLICNHAALDVVDALSAMLAQTLRPLQAELVVGLPTLGLAVAPLVARGLGHARYAPMGYSRKYWYDEAWSVPVQSITSPQPGKRLYLDPNLLPLLRGRRVVIVDDAVSTGTTLGAAWTLLEQCGAAVAGAGVLMRQGRRWERALGPDRAARVSGVFDSPLLALSDAGWVPRE
jgi:adenine/guanine phosphoribosyltransferase-like PRPP-binding protein